MGCGVDRQAFNNQRLFMGLPGHDFASKEESHNLAVQIRLLALGGSDIHADPDANNATHVEIRLADQDAGLSVARPSSAACDQRGSRASCTP
jgi:hypothetical protein